MHETLIRQTDQSLAASNTQYASTPSSNAISSEPSSPSSSSLPKGEKAGSTPRFQNQAVQMLSELRDSLERTGLPSRLRSEILSSMRSSALSLHQGRKFDPEDLKQRCQTILHKSLGRTDQSILLVLSLIHI